MAPDRGHRTDYRLRRFLQPGRRIDRSGRRRPGVVGRSLLGVAAAGLSGVAFAILTVGVRKTVTGNTSPEAVVFLMSVMGILALGPWSVYLLGMNAPSRRLPATSV